MKRTKRMDRGKGFQRKVTAATGGRVTFSGRARDRFKGLDDAVPKKPRARLRPVSEKRQASRAFYRAEVTSIVRRLGRRRFVCEAPPAVHAGHDCGAPFDPHHVVKRSQGGGDHRQNLVLLCRRLHDLTDAPRVSRTGRLMIAGHGDETFDFWWDRRRLDYGTEVPQYGPGFGPGQMVRYTRAQEETPCP